MNRAIVLHRLGERVRCEADACRVTLGSFSLSLSRSRSRPVCGAVLRAWPQLAKQEPADSTSYDEGE